MKVTPEYLTQFKERFSQLNEIIDLFNKRIGYTTFGKLPDPEDATAEDINDNEAAGPAVQEVTNPMRLTSVVFNNLTKGSTSAEDIPYKKLHKIQTIGPVTYIADSFSSGIGNYSKNPMLFLSTSAEFIAASSPSDKVKLADNAQKPGEAMTQMRERMKRTLKETTDHLTASDASNKDKKVTLLVLENSEKLSTQNYMFYHWRKSGALFVDNSNEESSLMKLIPNSGLDTNNYFANLSRVYWLNTGYDQNHAFRLKSADFDIFNNIHEETLGFVDPQSGTPNPFPLMIQSKLAISRAPKLAFPFFLFGNFDQYFMTHTRMSAMINSLVEAYKAFRYSFSDQTLTNVIDITQSFYILFAMKMAALEKNVIAQLEECEKSLGQNAAAQKDAITKILGTLEKSDQNPKARLKAMGRPYLENATTLTTHADAFAAFGFMRSLPEYAQLLELLTKTLGIRSDVEAHVLEICDVTRLDTTSGRHEVVPLLQPLFAENEEGRDGIIDAYDDDESIAEDYPQLFGPRNK